MSLNKTVLLTAFAASITLASTAHAATDAQVTITGQIAAATCDLSVTKNNIDLGTYTSSSISTSGEIASSSQSFTLNLTNCTKAYDNTGGTASPVNLYAKGTALAANTAYFNNKDGGTVGVKLMADATAVEPNVASNITSLKTLSVGGSASIPMTASLYSTVVTPASQLIEAPITFSIAYN
ncbi:fimbrial protein [Providencia sp. R33]|uniref:fimbrial protein n=1 Tax=Providencia sp. R33 TaxID=2828763 RepID=UPI002103DD53|nr:type 1 fimbrial protein [Providencia sp. R33]